MWTPEYKAKALARAQTVERLIAADRPADAAPFAFELLIMSLDAMATQGQIVVNDGQAEENNVRATTARTLLVRTFRDDLMARMLGFLQQVGPASLDMKRELENWDRQSN